MMFRPLALATAFAGSIGLSSAEINYAYESGEIISTTAVVLPGTDTDASDSVGVQLASKSEFHVSFSTNNFLILYAAQFSYVLFVFKSLHLDQRT